MYINCNWRVYHLAYFAKSDVSSCFWSLLSRFSSVGVEICWKTLVRTNFCNCLNASSYISQKKLTAIKPAQSNPFRNNKRSFSTNLTQLNNGMWKRHANLSRIRKVDGITPKQSLFTAIVCKWSFPMATKRKKKTKNLKLILRDKFHKTLGNYYTYCVLYRNQAFVLQSKTNDWFLCETQQWAEIK